VEPPGLLDMLRQAAARPEDRPFLVGSAACLGLLALVFLPNLKNFVRVWSNDGNYSHGFLVPLISLYFAHLAAQRGPVAVRSGVGLGMGLLTASLLGRLATILVNVGVVGDLSFVLGLAGMCALLVGNMMTLPRGVKMFVVEACSGMRQLTGFLALTVAVAYLSLRPAWYRVVVIASAVPIAMTANVARVVLTGSIMHWINPDYASGAYHTVEGLLMMGFGLSLLRAECWLMDQLIGQAPAAAAPTAVPPSPHHDCGTGTGAPGDGGDPWGGPAESRPAPAPDLQGRLLEQGWTIG
jgi:exosortase/archaeosortase family protein